MFVIIMAYWNHFEEGTDETLKKNRFYFSKFGKIPLQDVKFFENKEDYSTLIFGSEVAGLFNLIGEEKMKNGKIVTIPLGTESHRKNDTPSLNLSNATSIALWEAWKQTKID